MMDKKTELLIQAAKIIDKEGIQSFTIEYLAQKCQLTKGGVLYHFSSKRNLLIAMNEFIIKKYEKVLEQFQSEMSGKYKFTRAYAKATIHYLRNREHAFLPALLITSLEYEYCLELWEETTKRWEKAFERDMRENEETLQLRLICDGVWFSMMYNDSESLKNHMEKLILTKCRYLEEESN